MKIRVAENADAAALSKLGAATFAGTFQSLYTPENLSRFLAEFHSEDFYRSALSDPNVRIFVAEDAGKLIAYTKLGPNTLPCDPPLPKALELSRLYVLKGYRSKGLGHSLMNTILEYAKTQNYPEIVLGVFSENLGGQKFYARQGFEKIGEYYFAVGDHRDHEFILRRSV